MNTVIVPASPEDMDAILILFEKAIRYQQANGYIGWPNMDRQFIEADVNKGLLYKVLSEDKLLGIFCVCYTDQLIWRDKENGDAVYLHRIVLNREFAGFKVFKIVFDWALAHARKAGLRYVRMDTWAENAKLINYYKGYGFRFVENYKTENTTELPVQHRNLNVALLEFKIPDAPDQAKAPA